MEYLYIFRSYTKNGTLLKFGYTSDFWQRISQYKSQNPGIEIVYIAQLSDAFQWEQEFHNLHQATYGNEWYDESLLNTMMEFLNNIDHVDYTDSDRPKRVYKPKKDYKPKYKPKYKYKYRLANLKMTIDECKKDNTLLSKAYIKYPFLQEAIIKLGYEGIEKCGYQSTNIKRKLIQMSAIYKSDKVINSLKTRITLNTFISASDLKQLLADIYIEHNIETKAKASDINLYYEAKQHTPRINNKPVAGFIIKEIISCIDL